MYTKNINSIEKMIRIIISMIFICIIVIFDFNVIYKFILGIIAIILIITSMVSWCPLYSSRGSKSLNKISKRDIETAIKNYNPKVEEEKDTQKNIDKNNDNKSKKNTKKKAVKTAKPKTSKKESETSKNTSKKSKTKTTTTKSKK